MAAIALALACGPSSPATGPIVATAAAVAEVAIYRATQHGCWGACGAGAQCNEKSGFCEPIPCGGKCKSDWVCQVTGTGEECVPRSLSVDGVCAPVADAGSLLVVSCTDAGAR